MLKYAYFILAIVFTLTLFAKESQIITSITPNQSIANVNTLVTFTGKITSGKDIPSNTKVRYEEFINGILTRQGYTTLDKEIVLEHKMTTPGWYFVKLKMFDKNNKPIAIKNKLETASRGIIIAPQQIAVSSPRPKDFDNFWNLQRQYLNTVPVKEITRKEISKNKKSTLAAYDVKVSCAGSSPLTGILTMPRNAKLKSLPAFVFFQGAGVSKAVSFGGYGSKAMTLMVNAHGLENTLDKSYYQNLSKTSLKGYAHFNKDNREKIYFRDMFLRVMRALDYVKSLPQWNGKILVVRGGSQGGAQAIVAAAMDKQVTLLVAEVPAMCDHNGFLAPVKRRSGWPVFYTNNKNKKVIHTTSYYDMINFAPRITCESYITTGLTDLVSTPIGIACLYNAINSKNKHFLLHPTGGHIVPQIDSKFTKKFNKRIIEHFAE